MDSRTKSSHFQQVIETVESLPPDEQLLLIDIIRQRLIEQRRADIANAAESTLTNPHLRKKDPVRQKILRISKCQPQR